MTVPLEYQHASLDFEKFLVDARDAAGLVTTNQAYTMVDGVFRAFRHRLSVTDAIAFANALPPVLRSLFIEDWDTAEPMRSFGLRDAMTLEVQALRPNHNFAPPTAIRDVAVALRKNVDQEQFDRTLAGLPPGAAEFWST